jgi:trans-2-enoyl-CoA reductase
MRHTNFGTWRTHALATPADITPIADRSGLTPVQVGTVSVNPCTAYRMLRDFEPLAPGDFFIQNGANSGVGRAAIQLARLWNLRSINVIRDRPTPEETDALKQDLYAIGATHVVTEAELMARDFASQVAEWTDGGRAQVRLGLNCVGGKPTGALIKCLSQNGHLVTYGGMAKQPLQLPTAALIFKNIKFSGFWVSRWSDQHADEKQRMVDEILDLVRTGEFKDVPVQKIQWDWDTKIETLRDAVQGTLEGFRSGKGVFVYGDT